MTGHEYRKRIASYLVSAYWDRGIQVFEEVNLGTSIIGKQRRVDLFVLQPQERKAFALECKYQDVSGTADEKIPYTLQDLAALRMPSAVAYAGVGFSEGVLHLLQSSELAAYCMPDDTLKPLGRRVGESIDSGTWQLDHILAMAFGWWDVIVAGRTPLDG
ncbi:MAG TPA: PD-(D/E)XK nuclease superfamily protein [Polyangiaceae bacterium]|nr:PD-(D/E)XK nuclease superfamily protein [Polyangiaceae bacterium]